MKREVHILNRRIRRAIRRLRRDERGATMLEWALLLAAIGLPSYFIISIMLATLVAHYQMAATILALPIP